MNEITIYHNPNCGTSRNTLAMIRNSGVGPYEQLNLENNLYSDEQLIDFMLQYPILNNRPIVVTPLGVKLCRLSEVVLDILPNQQQSEFIKEDGQVIVDKQGIRIK
ncbi:ArsC/Spx/MgsR family protein [Providencia sp. Me31A]|uniref:ArsC/Spx/MgsR family protein n=1 Tax=Providencia sp. Me31A TaxID=3392637 RepID=UPI003D27369E